MPMCKPQNARRRSRWAIPECRLQTVGPNHNGVAEVSSHHQFEARRDIQSTTNRTNRGALEFAGSTACTLDPGCSIGLSNAKSVDSSFRKPLSRIQPRGWKLRLVGRVRVVLSFETESCMLGEVSGQVVTGVELHAGLSR